MNTIMSRLHHEEVRWMTLSEISKKISSGGTPLTSHSEYYKGDIPWLRTQEVDWKNVYDTEIKITEEAVANSSAKWIPANCVIVAMYGATAGKCCMNMIPLTTNQACCNLEIDETIALSKYVYYWLCKEYENLKSMGEGSQCNINGRKIRGYRIPIPPIEAQQEIVDTCDSMELLIAKLKEEQDERKRQFEYYREELMEFDRNDKTLKWEILDNIGYTYGGLSGKTKGDFECGNGRYIEYMNVFTNHKLDIEKTSAINIKENETQNCIQYGDVLFTISSETSKECGMSSVVTNQIDEKLYLNSFCFGYRFNDLEKINPLFYAYYFRSNKVRSQIIKAVNGVTRFNLSKSKFVKMKIAIPTKEKQNYIATRLDNMMLLQDKLQAEIDMREKQLEYYREKLMTF